MSPLSSSKFLAAQLLTKTQSFSNLNHDSPPRLTLIAVALLSAGLMEFPLTQAG